MSNERRGWWVACTLTACSAGSTSGRDAALDRVDGAQAACTAIAVGTPVMASNVDGGYPSASGGVIASGDYELREVISALPVTTPRAVRGALRVRGSSVELALEEAGQLNTWAGTLTTLGNVLELDATCPSPAWSRMFNGFTATGDGLDWHWSPNEVFRWARR